MEAAKSIDALYEEIRDYDLVICNDAPLCTALSNRVDKAVLGDFIVTPRMLVSSHAVELSGKPIIEDIELVRAIADETGYGMRFVHGEVENIRNSLKYAKEPRNLSRRSRNVWTSYQAHNTLEMIMRNMKDDGRAFLFANYKRIAVIGLDLFDELDKNLLPPVFDEIEITDYKREFEIEEVRILGNDRQIADCVIDIVQKCGPNDVAVVIDTTGPIADAVKSSLYRAQKPFINSLEIKDIASIRNFLEFIQLSLSFETVKVRDVREIISAYGGFIKSQYDEYYISKYKHVPNNERDTTPEKLKIMAKVREHTFEDVCYKCIPSGDRSSVVMLLEQMNCLDAKVSQELLSDLLYAVNSISTLKHNEQQPDEEKKGVLLVDCKNSVYIDRPVVIYTGMCSEWETDLGKLDYIDPKKRPEIEDQNILRFRTLIQQGSVRFYFVNATKGGKEAIPCKYFDACLSKELGGRPVESFRDICSNPITGMWDVERNDRSVNYDEDHIGAPNPKETISNSTYMKYVECPRAYMFSRLVKSPENTYTFTGSRLHDYAEFRISYPEIAKENGTEYYIRMITDECAKLYSPDLAAIEEGKIRSAVETIDWLADNKHITAGKLVQRTEKDPNVFFAHHGLTDRSEHTEDKITSRDLRMEGKLDLVWDNIIYDYKSGEPKTYKDLAKYLDITTLTPKKRTDMNKSCQPLFYTNLLRSLDVPNREFDFVYTQTMYQQKVKGEIPAPSQSIRRVVFTNDWRESIREAIPNIFNDVKKYANYDVYAVYDACVDRYGEDPDAWIEHIEDKDFQTFVTERAKERTPDKSGITNNVTHDAIKKLANALKNVFVSGDCIAVRWQDIERFRERFLRDVEDINSYYDKTGESYPAIPVIKCSVCDYRNMCTREVIDSEVAEDDSE